MSEPERSQVGRRAFLNWFLGTSFGALLVWAFYPVARYLSPPDVPEASTNQVEAGTTDDPELVEKGYKIVRFGAEPVILVRVSDTDYRAFSATCTHLSCIVQYRRDRKLIWCYCHNGSYDLTGRNVGGPPPRPLTPFAVHLVDRSGSTAKSIVVERT